VPGLLTALLAEVGAHAGRYRDRLYDPGDDARSGQAQVGFQTGRTCGKSAFTSSGTRIVYRLSLHRNRRANDQLGREVLL
jgi:hypothetical protein